METAALPKRWILNIRRGSSPKAEAVQSVTSVYLEFPESMVGFACPSRNQRNK
jgi:hypothetical protein